MKLSILICSHHERDPLLKRMLEHLQKQIDEGGFADGVELLYCKNDGSHSRGYYRNELLNLAKGEYVCFVDDDDVLADNYISMIIAALRENPDIVGIKGKAVSLMNGKASRFVLSMQHDEVFSLPNRNLQNGEYHRCASHLNPIKREIALAVRFPDDKNVGEDNEYSKRLKAYFANHPYKEIIIDEILYYYFTRVTLE